MLQKTMLFVFIVCLSFLQAFPLYGSSRVYTLNLYIEEGSHYSTIDSLKVKELDEVVVTATQFLFVNKGDTTLYDIGALSLKSGALLQDAFKKMPGMSFRDGALYHNGIKVKRILINGLDYSKKNPLLALQTLPSYIMKNIKVYEKRSDFSEKTGIDDGLQELVADVSVRRKYLGLWTGEITVGGGTESRFLSKGFGNTFTDNFRVSLFGNVNNINEQLWYNGDGKERMGTAQPGDNQFYTPGATFLWKNKKSLKDKGYFKLSGGIDYNKELYKTLTLQHSELYLSDGSLFAANKTQGVSDRGRLSGNFDLNWNISTALSLSYISSVNMGRYNEETHTLKASWNENPITKNESIADVINVLLSSNSQASRAIDLQQKKNFSVQHSSVYEHQLGLNYTLLKSRTYFNLKHSLSVKSNKQEETQNAYYKYFNQDAHRSYGLHRSLNFETNKDIQGLNARITQYFTVKGFRRFALSIEYRYNKNNTTYDGIGYLTNIISSASQTSNIDNETTRSWREWGFSHSIEPKLSIGNGIFSFEFTPSFNSESNLLNFHKRGLDTLTIQRNYQYWNLEIFLRLRSPQIGSLLGRYHITATTPNIHSLINYPDRADPQYIIVGNKSLKMGNRHVLTAWYSRNFIQERKQGKLTRTLSAHIFYSRDNNAISQIRTYDRKTGVVTTLPVNVSGNWSGKTNIGFTTPLDVKQRFLIETLVESSIYQTQTFSGGSSLEEALPEMNHNRLLTYKASIKPHLRLNTIDLKLDYSLILENNHSTYASGNNKRQWQHALVAKLNWKLPLEINLSTDCRYLNYGSYINGKRKHWTMLGFDLERSFLKDRNLTLGVSISDLLNQNNGFVQQYTATELTHTNNQTLGRYAMLTLRYRFSSKKYLRD